MSAAPISPDAPITAVHVYQRGALITRTIQLQAPFPDRLEIPGLPLSLAPETVRLRLLHLERGADGDDLVVAGVHVALHTRPREAAPEAPAAVALREARQALARQVDLRDQLQLEVHILGAVQSPPRPEGEEGRPPPMSPMHARVSLEAFTHTAISARIAALREQEAEILRLRREVAALEAQLQRATRAGQVRPDELSFAAQLRLHVEGVPLAATLALEYRVPGACWAPTYQCLIDRAAGRVTLQMRAAVVQRTGEDWSNVAMRFSTALPTTHSRLPDLTSIRIGKAQPPPPSGRGYRPPPQGSDTLFTHFDGARTHLLQRFPPHTPPRPARPAVYRDHFPTDLDTLAERLGVPVVAAAPVATRDRLGHAGGGEGAAPPPPPSPSPSVTATALAARSSSASRAKKKGALPPHAREESAKETMSDDFFSKSPSYGKAEVTAPEIRAASERMLSFSQLHLPDPTQVADRGKLLPRSSDDLRAELARRTGQQIDLNIDDEIAQASMNADDVFLPGGLIVAQSVQGRLDYAYAAENRLDVPGDGGVHVVPVLRWEGACPVSYVLVPRVEPLAYRRAEIQNPSTAPLLPGPAEVYVDGQYAVTADIPLVGAGGKLSLGLGVEQAIRCARNAHFQERRSGEKVVAMTELLHDIEIELVNTLPRAALCEIRERIPHPAPGAEVVVDEEAISPPWATYTQRERHAPIEGGRRWQITLAPGETRRLQARYIVKIYANNELVGGNRREA